MKSRGSQSKSPSQPLCRAIAILWVASLGPGLSVALGQEVQEPATTTSPTQEAWVIPADQLDSLVAPIALYPDPLLSQTLVASTYPLEIIQLQQWLEKNKGLKDQALADAVLKQNWDPSVQSMVAVPDVVQRLALNIQWTTDLGNAFLAQPADVMAAVQRMRAKAQGANALVSNQQQTVGTEVVEGGTQVITIQQADPKVIYVPSYDPVVVYGAPVYPYPSYIYPGYMPGTGLAFGAGLILGATWGGGWGYHCGWGGHGDVNINYNNSYTKVNNVNNINRGQQGGKWQHQPQHRGGAPYGNRGTADRFGGRTAGQRPTAGANRPGGGAGIGSGAGNRPGGGAGIGSGAGNRPGGGAGIGSGGGNRPSTKPATRPAGGNGIGNRSVSPGSGQGAAKSAFGGSGGGGGAARASSSRGASSMRSSASRGGGSRGGGGGGGGSRGGGGRRR